MKNSKSRISHIKYYLVISFVSLLMLPVFIFAQDPGVPDGDPDIPIDGGVGILVAAGIGYGYKKYRNSRNKSDRANF